ncbi:hypothetical protein [Methylobacterium mesophilicum]
MHPVATRTPTDRLELHKALRLFYGDSRERSADTDIDWPRVRDLARNSIREALAHDRVPAFVFEETGRQHPIPAWLWNGSGLWAHAYESCLVKVPLEGRTVSGYLLVDQAAFERLLTPAPQAPNPAEQAYTPPLVAYLLEVAERFDLTADYRFSKELMADWIAKNPPPGVKMSQSRALNLARYLGHPDFDGGGQPGDLTGKRPPDPCVPYHGVQYPKPRRER